MRNVLAIVSKAIFEANSGPSGKPLEVGELWPTSSYLSLHRVFEALSGGGRLFLVTVRPTDERLWLVAILESPTKRSDGWHAAPNRVSIRDVSHCKTQLRFTSGKGLSSKPGALAMSLQTPRELAPEDVTLLLAGNDDNTRASAVNTCASGPSTAELQREFILDLSWHRWQGLSTERRAEVLAAVSQSLAPGFLPTAADDPPTHALALYRHDESSLDFALIAGGRFELGFTEAEIKRLKMLAAECDDADDAVDLASAYKADAVEIDVAPFLLAVEPLGSEVLADMLGSDDAVTEKCCIEPKYAKKAMVALTERGLRLPSEAEWEYACRAGTRALFPGGSDDVPNEPNWPVNGFSISGMGELPELCADEWHDSRAKGPKDARPWKGSGATAAVTKPNLVLRGGGSALLYPWQGPDWILSVCANRQTLAGAEYYLAIRPALSIANDSIVYADEQLAARKEGGIVTLRRLEKAPPRRGAPFFGGEDEYGDDEDDGDNKVEDEAHGADDEHAEVELTDAHVRHAGPKGPLGSTLILDMYGKVLGDLADLRNPALRHDDAEKLLLSIRARRIAGVGSYYSNETAAQIPSILQLLAEKVPARGALCLLTLDLIFGGHQSKLPHLAWEKAVSQVPPCFANLAAGKDTLVEVLQDEGDADARSGVVLLLATTLRDEEGLKLLLQRLTVETDVAVRASIAVALGVVAWSLPEERRLAPRDALLTMLLRGGPVEHMAAALGLGTLDGASAPDEVLPILGQMMMYSSVSGTEGFRWCAGDLRAHALAVAEGMGPRGESVVTAGLLRRILMLKGQKQSRREASFCANALIAQHFRYRTEPVDTNLWSPFQWSLAKTLSEPDAPEARWDERGLPVDVTERRAVLGMK